MWAAAPSEQAQHGLELGARTMAALLCQRQKQQHELEHVPIPVTVRAKIIALLWFALACIVFPSETHTLAQDHES